MPKPQPQFGWHDDDLGPDIHPTMLWWDGPERPAWIVWTDRWRPPPTCRAFIMLDQEPLHGSNPPDLEVTTEMRQAVRRHPISVRVYDDPWKIEDPVTEYLDIHHNLKETYVSKGC